MDHPDNERLLAASAPQLTAQSPGGPLLWAGHYSAELTRRDMPEIVSVSVCFRKSTPTKSMWRSFERYCSGPYCHIETAFVFASGMGLGFTVDRASPHVPDSGFVRAFTISATEYPPAQWELFLLNDLTQEERQGLLMFLRRQVGRPMDYWALYANFLPVLSWFSGSTMPSTQYEESAYFCSHLVGCALRWACYRRYSNINPRKLTPCLLYTLLGCGSEQTRIYTVPCENSIVV